MQNNQDIKNILLVKPGAIGDLLQLTPVVRALAIRYPTAQLTLMVGSQPRLRSSGIILPLQNCRLRPPGRASFIFFLFKLWRRIKRAHYDLVIHFQRSNLKTWFLVTAAMPCRILVYHKAGNRAVHVVDNYLETIVPCGITGQSRHLELSWETMMTAFRGALFPQCIWWKDCHCPESGASHPVNRWPAERFAELADLLAERILEKSLSSEGKKTNARRKITSATRSHPLVLCGQLTLLQLGAVLRRCALLVSGDTGPLHMATAVGTRVWHFSARLIPCAPDLSEWAPVIQAKTFPVYPAGVVVQ